MFYEFKHPLKANYCREEEGIDFEFPAHMHHCFEILAVTEGQMEVEVDEKVYMPQAGEALFVFPNQIHSMKTPQHSRHVLCLFSTDIVNTYYKKISANVPENALFHPDPFYIEEMKKIPQEPGELFIKGLMYTLCAVFDTTAVYKETLPGTNELLYTIFHFIENNYNGFCLLSDLAKNIGYDYAYLSRYFKKTVGISYNDYVNQYRISKACHMLKSSGLTVLEISTACGFSSLRSMNRNFKEQLGISPSLYRKNNI